MNVFPLGNCFLEFKERNGHRKQCLSVVHCADKLKDFMVHDASSSSKETYSISPIARSPVSHSAPSPQESCKRKKYVN